MNKKRKLKNSKEDFLFSSLPSSRKKQFVDIIKNRVSLFVKIGLLLSLFSLPLFALIFAKDLTLSNIRNSNLSEADMFSSLYSVSLTYDFFMAVGITLIFLPLGGFFRIFRSLAYDEGTFFFYDFKKGFSQTWLACLISGLIIGFGYFSCSFYQKLINVDYLSYLPLAFLFLLILPLCLTFISYNSIYTSSFFVSLTNAFVLTSKAILKIWLFILLISLPFLFLLIPVSAVRYILLFLFFAFYYPFVIFGLYLLYLSLFDRFINKDLNNGLYLKGLYIQNDNSSFK